MENIAPYVDQFLLPDGCRLPVVAADQPEYLPLPAIATPSGQIVSQWKPDAGEVEMLKNGVPITLACWTFGSPLQPLAMAVGGMDLRHQDRSGVFNRLEQSAKEIANAMGETFGWNEEERASVARVMFHFALLPKR